MAEQFGVTPPELRGVSGDRGEVSSRMTAVLSSSPQPPVVQGDGLGPAEGPDDPGTGRDGESHLVEDYFRANPPSGDAIVLGHLGLSDAVPRIAEVLTQIYAREIHIGAGLPPLQRLFEATGSDFAFYFAAGSYPEVGDTLGYLGLGSLAIVASVVDDHDVVFVAVNIAGEVHLYDPVSDVLTCWPPPWSQDAGAATMIVYLDARGDPVLPCGEFRDRRLVVRSRLYKALVGLSEADRLALGRDVGALNEDFAAAMQEDVAPGSKRANALAERHLAYARRLFADYGYQSHRADGRWLVTVGWFRDPLEWVAPGLARYVRDVIVANAEYHLGPPDDPDPDAPPPVGP